MKKAIGEFVMFVAEIIVIVGFVYYVLASGIVEAVVSEGAEVINEHVEVQEHFEGIEIGSDGINTVYSKRLIIK